MAEVSELVIQIRATAEGLEATIQNASQLVRKFAQEAEAATSKPLKVEVQTDSIRDAISDMIGLGETVKKVSTAGAVAGTLLKSAMLDVGASLLATGLTWLLNIIIQGIDDMIHAQERAEKLRKEQIAANDEAIQSAKEETKSYIEQADSLRALGDEYALLRRKRRTRSEEIRFLELQKELAGLLGTTEDAVYSQAASFEVWENVIKRASDSQMDKAIQNMERVQEIQEKNIDLANRKVADNIPYTTPFSPGNNPHTGMMTSGWVQTRLPAGVNPLASKADRAEAMAEAREAYRKQFIYFYDEMLAGLQKGGKEFSAGAGEYLKTLLLDTFALPEDFGGTDVEKEKILMGLQKMKAGAEAILTDSTILGATDKYNGLVNQLLWGDISAEEAAPEMAEQLNAIQHAVYENLVNKAGMGLEEARDAAIAYRNTLTGGEREVLAFAQSIVDSSEAARLAAQGFGEYSDAFTKLGQDTRTLTAQKQALDTMKKLAAQYKDNAKAGRDNAKTQELLEKTAKAAGVELKKENGQLTDLDQSLDTASKTLQGSAALTEAGIHEIITALEAEKAAIIDANGNSIDVDTNPAIAAINAAIQVLQFFLSLLGQAGLGVSDTPPKSGGGGGGKRKSKAELEEEARREAEKARQEALRQDYELLSHKRHMNELTLEAELSMLEEIRRKHALNAKEIMEWEEKVYDLKKELRERDAGSIDKTGDALIDALAARYEAMQEAEIDRLDASRQAWEDWRDSSVKAIQDQIDALEELAQTEDREKQDQEELRKIARLRQERLCVVLAV